MVIAALSLTLEGRRRQQVVRSLRALSGPTLVEPGCIACRVLEEVAEPSHLHYLEMWETTDQLVAHLRSKGYRQVLAAMEESAVSPQLKFFWVSDVKGIEYLESVRLDLMSQPPADGIPGPSINSSNPISQLNIQGNSLEAS
jgi:quinol monooxygenase YgiN